MLHVLEGLKSVWMGTVFVCLSVVRIQEVSIAERSLREQTTVIKQRKDGHLGDFELHKALSQLKCDSCASDVFGTSVALCSCALGLHE